MGWKFSDMFGREKVLNASSFPVVISGQVSSAGAWLAGSGFSVVRNSAGKYTITFNTPFSEAPICIAIPLGTSGYEDATIITAPTTTSVQFGFAISSGGAFTDARFWFVIIGVVPSAPGSVLPVTYGTSLPASPADGQEAILVDSTAAPTYQWRFRYNAGSTNTDKWEFIGGTPKIVSVSTAETTASGAAADLTTVGPTFAAPRAGVYAAQINADGANNTAGGDTFLDFKAGTNAAVSVTRMNRNSTANVGGGGGGSVPPLARVAAGDALKMQYHVATGTGTFENRTMMVWPVRVS